MGGNGGVQGVMTGGDEKCSRCTSVQHPECSYDVREESGPIPATWKCNTCYTLECMENPSFKRSEDERRRRRQTGEPEKAGPLASKVTKQVDEGSQTEESMEGRRTRKTAGEEKKLRMCEWEERGYVMFPLEDQAMQEEVDKIGSKKLERKKFDKIVSEVRKTPDGKEKVICGAHRLSRLLEARSRGE